MGSTGIAFQDADKSQLARGEIPASDRIAFALSLLETGLRMCPAEKSRDSDPVLSGAVRSLRSRLLRNNREKWAYFAYLRGGRRNFSAVKTCWRRECDANSHYRFEFRNPRRLPNLEAVQHLTDQRAVTSR